MKHSHCETVYGPRAKASLFVLGGQEGLKDDSNVEFSADSEKASLTKIWWSVFSQIGPESKKVDRKNCYGF